MRLYIFTAPGASARRANLDLARWPRHLEAVKSPWEKLPAMTTIDETRPESQPFEADVAKLLSLMVHSVYANKDVFLRELISNAADACEKLRYEAIANPAPARRRPQAPHHARDRCRQPHPHRRGQRHRHGPRRDRRGARNDRALRHQGLHGPDRGRARRRGRDADRPVRRGLLFRLHGRRTASTWSRAVPAPTRPGCGRRTARARSRSRPPRSRTLRSAAPASSCT